ncbi:MAG: rhodanese-like domain-containing protein [Deltaproteobacteria bacterium]|nr:rhodanese-like domain-containing protein [Deltaproteobacteria bacterium]MBI3295193.1 rhodanese-like domain-containing protein [Deltaproteobacteria bacterium]
MEDVKGSALDPEGMVTKPSDVKAISRLDLIDRMNRDKNLQIVNVLDPKYYNLGFIHGSLKIPVAEIEKRAGELDKSREVVTYCSGYQCDASRKGAEKLSQLGFNAVAYEGGIQEWKESGFPVEGERQAA